jgi:hypothetical protein
MICWSNECWDNRMIFTKLLERLIENWKDWTTLFRNVKGLISEYKLSFYAERRRRRGEVAEERDIFLNCESEA